MPVTDVTPEEIVTFWFPDGPTPKADKHLELWMWRMRGGANDQILDKYSQITHRAVVGKFDHWQNTALGRLALIIILDQFSRTVYAGTADAYAQDPKALELCLAGLQNGHFEALDNVWYKTAFRIPLEHCECPDHLENLNKAVEIGEMCMRDAPEELRAFYQIGIDQPKKHREVIAQFGRHPHRNAILGRKSTPAEEDYLRNGEMPHERELKLGN